MTIARDLPAELPVHAPGCGCAGVSRRGVLGMATAVAVAGATPSRAAAERRIVDVHSHYLPPALRNAGAAGPMAGWDLARLLGDMDAAGVEVSVLSLTSPGVVAEGVDGLRLMREANDYAARLVADHGQRLRFFAYLKPLDVDASLEEARRGLDTLGASGVGLFTSYQGKYIGDPVFDPLFEELDRRGAVVFVHPNSPTCCKAATLLPDTAIEYGTETTRALASYIYSGAAKRFPNVRLIWNHAGGTMPALTERFAFLDRTGQFKATAPDGFLASLGRCYFDLAQATNRINTAALRQVVPTSRILFGTDYPFRTMKEHVSALEANGVFSAAELTDIYRRNVERDLAVLLPAARA